MQISPGPFSQAITNQCIFIKWSSNAFGKRLDIAYFHQLISGMIEKGRGELIHKVN